MSKHGKQTDRSPLTTLRWILTALLAVLLVVGVAVMIRQVTKEVPPSETEAGTGTVATEASVPAATETAAEPETVAPTQETAATAPVTAVTLPPTAPPTQPASPTQPPASSLSGEVTASLNSSITASNVLLYDVTHDRVLFARGAEEQIHPASLTKLMTAAVAVKYATGEDYTVGREVYLKDPQASSAYLSVGTVLTLEQMLQAMLLPSGADAAYCLAVTTIKRMYPEENLSDFKAAERFCDLMNEELKAIGADATFFVNPDGMDHTYHLSTASDMQKVFSFALSFPQVREAVGMATSTFTPEKGKQVTYVNTNRLLNRNTPYYYQYCTGGKTGSTGRAGYCLGSVAEKDGVTLMALVFGCKEENLRFTESAALFNAGFAAVQS